MTIRNIEHFTNALWDWSCLDGCFTGKMRPTDIDGLIERNGRFLLLEAKSSGATLGRGQQRTYDALLATGYFTVIVIWGHKQQPERIRVSTKHNGKVVSIEQAANLDVLREMVRRWFVFANGFQNQN